MPKKKEIEKVTHECKWCGNEWKHKLTQHPFKKCPECNTTNEVKTKFDK